MVALHKAKQWRAHSSAMRALTELMLQGSQKTFEMRGMVKNTTMCPPYGSKLKNKYVIVV
jgi:hypothetical protein